LIGVHAQIYRATYGLIGHRFPGAPPMLLLDHVAANSGTPRTTPLAYVQDGPDVVIVASKRRPPEVDLTRFGGHVAAGLGSLVLDHDLV
jgi:hypothetical protein